MFERLRRVFDESDGGFAECRRCGCRVEDPTGSCGECGSHEVASYDL